MELSVVIPVYNEEKNLEELYHRLKQILDGELKLTHEIIFVDDGSKDTSWEKILTLAEQDVCVKGFRFSRNFGHQSALKAGLDYSTGDAVVSMDADLQHPPAMIRELYAKYMEGYQIVNALREDNKGAGFWKKITSAMYYRFVNAISDIRIEEGSSDFRLISRQVADQISAMKDYYLFLRGVVSWIGFKTAVITYVADERFSGKTKYSLRKMLSLAWNGITSFSVKPLRLATITGLIISLFAFLYIVYAVLAKFAFDNALPGWTSILISVLFLGGIQLLCIGIIGEYLGKTFMEVKNRPNYIVSEQTKK